MPSYPSIITLIIRQSNPFLEIVGMIVDLIFGPPLKIPSQPQNRDHKKPGFLGKPGS